MQPYSSLACIVQGKCLEFKQYITTLVKRTNNTQVQLLQFNFILGLNNFIFLCFKLILIHYHTQKQRTIKFKPRIKLNHNITVSSICLQIIITYKVACLFCFIAQRKKYLTCLTCLSKNEVHRNLHEQHAFSPHGFNNEV